MAAGQMLDLMYKHEGLGLATPQVALDLHTTNGTRHAYHLTYSPPLHPGADPTIVDILRKDWFPTITTQVRAKYGWEYSYYGNVGGTGRRGGAAVRWT